MSLKNKTIFITGASRGIGEAIAMRCAKDGANVVVASKTAEPNVKLPGTIFTVAEEVERLGGKALPIQLDIRFEDQVHAAVAKTIEKFGGIDILINNAGAIFPMPTLQTPIKRFDLMFDCNVRGAFLCSQACLPYLMKSRNPHILNMSPPPKMEAKWFKDHLAYTMSKYGMSMCTLGMSAEFKEAGVAVNSLWPKTTIATAAIAVYFPQMLAKSRQPSIVADAAYAIVKKDSRKTTGNFFIDEEVLENEGISDLSQYAVDAEESLQVDLFID
jgi:citronellol/citronellal dehydrogenase